ncbi:hypothetical protein [Streptomyces viridochromogenes]|uniref:hypothetical protein n=1 Tax=Streptomyces viridochromogenes TaxID=1938 RepID=UPI00131DB08E|nr:hypothetical protein [Streptomyces viridochromogenes]
MAAVRGEQLLALGSAQGFVRARLQGGQGVVLQDTPDAGGPALVRAGERKADDVGPFQGDAGGETVGGGADQRHHPGAVGFRDVPALPHVPQHQLVSGGKAVLPRGAGRAQGVGGHGATVPEGAVRRWGAVVFQVGHGSNIRVILRLSCG